MAKSNREMPEINAASMADIAFLLLIFFLLVTTIDTDKGIPRKLPPMPEGPPPIVKLHNRNVFVILVNSEDQLMVEGKMTKIQNLKQMTEDFVLNPEHLNTLSDSPKDAIISLKNDRGTSYKMYVLVQNELTAAYDDVRDKVGEQQFGAKYDDLNRKQQKKIKDEIPMRISEAEPENVGGK